MIRNRTAMETGTTGNAEGTATKESIGEDILLIEDDFFVRDIYQRKLKEHGYVVRTAENGLEGMDRLREKRPDLVLLDVFMPFKDGREVLRDMRESDEWKDVPVIMLTNFSESEGVRDGFSLGADEYLIKSHFTPSEVLTKIRKVLEEHGKNAILETSETVLTEDSAPGEGE